ncbi:hypothetical protein B9Z51_15295 [Limnohabitans sp. T6-5]|uniref:DUF599 domain-containing protein n=1 Tax=Limnohabitans sp. T6-5 TaxID=1100724 RepID=UPI000D3A600C|nr:DUF599 domain-containing protein [Limnohabitans sp. T6-5]PUE07217.1 hypothetical protein B9Z51_15295 [Limnohabitans sp. T6-5]
MKIMTMLPWLDWLALVAFFSLWVGYAWFAKVRGKRDQSLIATTNLYRQQWMLQATARDPRMLDGLITQNLSHTPSFFSSTTIIIIGGLFALLGTTDKAAELVREIPFAQPTPILVFEFKVLVLVGIFVYAFFRFSWSMRQYTFVALVIGAMPPPEEFDSGRQDRQAVAQRAGHLVGAAAETFNDGLRAYYFSFAAMAWFFSPLALVLATALVVLILYGREFRSDVLLVLRD